MTTEFPQCWWCGLPCQPGEWVAVEENGTPGFVHKTCQDEWNDRTDPLPGPL